jgi:hypothetical protein
VGQAHRLIIITHPTPVELTDGTTEPRRYRTRAVGDIGVVIGNPPGPRSVSDERIGMLGEARCRHGYSSVASEPHTAEQG